VRVVTWNVRHGRPRHGFASNRALAGAVRGFDADLVAVQEVDRRVIRSWFADQPMLVARAASACFVRFAPARHLALIGYDGIALCVRGRFERVRVLELPREFRIQKRVAIIAGVIVDNVAFTAVTTHLHNDAPVAQRQLDALLVDIAAEPRPRLLLGDLNLRQNEVEPRLRASGFDLVETGPTEPAWAPVQRIDHVAVDGLVVGDAFVSAVPVSDHRPVAVELRPAPSPSP
jgi:endonuclease/exonuclease/phosphatase family metal-dependent hydrolase